MGLDMYLERSVDKYYLQEKNPKLFDALAEIDLILPNSQVKKFTSEIGYWRKANAIHKWFVDNVQNGVDECQKSRIEISDLLALKAACEVVLEDPEVAMDVLPPEEGFFFGSTDIDEWYTNDLADTVAIINKIIEEHDANFKDCYVDYYYQASW